MLLVPRPIRLQAGRRWGRLIVLAALIAAGLVPAVASGLGPTYLFGRDFAPDEHTLWGNLTWADGKGGIRWGPPDGSEPVSAKAESPGQEELVFTSDPLPIPVFLNVSRNIKVDLLRSGPSDPYACDGQLEIRLEVDGVMLGGAGTMVHPNSFAIDGSSHRPLPPEGFGWCSVLIGAEQAYLPRGAIVAVIVRFHESGSYQFGTADGANSLIRLPGYSPEEAVYRMPEVFPRVRFSGSSEELGRSAMDWFRAWTGEAAGFAGLAIALTGTRRRNARTGILLTLLLLPASLAGCLGGPSQEPVAGLNTDPGRPSVSLTYYEPGDTGLANTTVGSLLGRVEDTYGFPVSGAFVGLRPTALFTRTNANGLFAFKQIEPGSYAIRVDRATFESVEANVEARPGEVVQIDIVMRYAEGLDADRLPHRHDYWNGENTSVVFDAPLMSSCSTVECHDVDGFYVRPITGRANLIRPGTSDVEVRLDFDPQITGYQRIGLLVESNVHRWQSFYLPRESGVPFHVRSTWEMTDVGHQLYSTWTFSLLVFAVDAVAGDPLDEAPDPLSTTDPPIIDRAVIQIHRGALPLEPPHPDHWLGKTEIWLKNDETVPENPHWAGGGEQTFYMSQSTGGCHTPGVPAVGGYYTSYKEIRLSLGYPDSVVPVETMELELILNMTRPSGTTETGKYGWIVWYKSGETPPVNYFAGSGTHRQGPDGKEAVDRLSWTWKIPVAAGEADGIYNKKSAWHFVLLPDDPEAACIDRTMGAAGSGTVFTWSLNAKKS